MSRGRFLPAALAALALLISLLQRPGKASSDTKIDLHVDPAGFLADVASAWSSTGDLGHVQGGQYGGYLFPMGPFFALGHALGGAPWLVQRLWLALILALAAWGAVRLMDELVGPTRGLPHVVAGLLFLLNPYVVVFTARTSITLLGYAALPWLLVAVRRGLLARGWRWPAAFALIVTASGGGVNAAVTAWVLLGPVLLGLYLWWTGAVRPRALWSFGWRTGIATAFASAWWVMPLLVQSAYGVDFLRFTEQPGTIWSTTSLPESLRLMGYWISYLGVGYSGELRPYFGGGALLLFGLPVVLAGTLVPALALASFSRTRGQRFAPFALGLVLIGLIVMTVGFPEGTPLRKASNFTYNHFVPVQFLRTTYKAGPLVALGVAVLAGLAATKPRAVVFVALAIVACWPLARGRALDDQLLWDRIPSAWQDAADHVDANAGDGRAVVLPGQLYAYYDWGGTIDPILPTLADKPVATRNAVGYADLHATDLLWTVDALVQQRRAVPGQLDPLLDLLGARVVVAGADDDRSRSGAAPAAEAADVLDQLGGPVAAWGERRPRPRATGTLGDPRELPAVRAWDRPMAPGLVRVEPEQPPLVVDGSAEGLAALAAFEGDHVETVASGSETAAGGDDDVAGSEGAAGGAAAAAGLSRGGLAYAADLSPRAIAAASEVVITDSNRRRVLVPSRLAQNAGPVLAASEEPSVDAAVLNPFPDRGAAAQTVAVYDGIEAVTAPSSPGFPQFPENRPFAALDGNPATHWQADRALTPDRHTLTVTFDAPRDVKTLELLPYNDRRATVTAVEVQGRHFAAKAGWNRLDVGLRGVKTLTVRIAAVRKPTGPTAGAGGIRELRIAGLQVREALRVPTIAEDALKGSDTALTYLFQRTTGDDPFRRTPKRGPSGAALVRDRLDGETGLSRVFSPPSARAWTLDGWANAAPAAPDEAFDRLVGIRGTFRSSGRFEGRPEYRASSAFDGIAREWLGAWLEGRPAWIEWAAGQRTVRRLTLMPVGGVRRPTSVRLIVDGNPSPVLPVTDNVVELPRPVTGSRFRLEILRAVGDTAAARERRAVGIAEILGAGVTVEPRLSGPLPDDCLLAGTVAGKPIRLRAVGTIEDLDAGQPVRVTGCETVALPAGEARLELPAGVLAPYLLRLRSGSSAALASPGRVVDPGTAGHDGSRDGIRLSLTEPARLVLAESYTRGRRATCDGEDLGEPEIGAAFGTSWRVPATCKTAAITFAPNRTVKAGYAVSLLAILILIGALFRRGNVWSVEETPSREAPTARLSARRAALIAVPAALALGFVFAARATPLFAVLVFLVLYRGVGAKHLAAAGGAILVVAVPLLTVLIRPENRGGFNPEYPADRIVVHWVAVAGVTLLLLALVRELLSRASGRRAPGPAAPPSAAAPPPPAP
ncbi:alpha-(1-_3)-arabinofuranosyltransferase [Solirubrobacter phytolaccae]|uniref:Alpha-(1->3)-arabinofuranosyltransferase n=1 Tax=Solirubrobacter phytolaccae TaxID=1404360 RepID=A0A9X3S8U5_9ACTN|nr:alpha-(1->3)-arabinofuranosyltransferase family protein [Solirubrobacter phytolaccae]MDA0182644.1 alpha-(1->3)-arabinofuranosyltransferase [Solirubrobacter phytolaccae]